MLFLVIALQNSGFVFTLQKFVKSPTCALSGRAVLRRNDESHR